MVFTRLIEELNSSVFILLVLLFATFWGIYKISCLLEKWRFKESELMKLRDDWNSSIPFIKERVDLLFQRGFPNSAIKTSSPVKLTETGTSIADAINAEGILDKQEATLEKLVNERSPNNAYDLQQGCLRVVEDNIQRLLTIEESEIAKSKSLEYGIPLDNALAIIAVLLRDRLMKKRGWLHSDIDKHGIINKKT